MTPEPDFSLPIPSTEDQIKSLKLIEHLRMRMLDGPLTFSEYMAETLYHPDLGYYGSAQVKFGAGGDFVTAPERSPFFSAGLVYEWQQIQRENPVRQVCELGAGSGQLALDFLRECETRDCLPDQYLIWEISPGLRKRQQERLKAELKPELWARLVWVDDPDATGISDLWTGGMVIANEVLDAMPVCRFRWQPGQLDTIEALRVGYLQGRFGWVVDTASPDLRAALADYAGLWPLDDLAPEPVAAEINLALPEWLAAMRTLFGRSDAASVLYLFDYGGHSAEVYRPDRTDGTLRCHYRHRAHDDPFVYPGLQDITTWVDFERLARLASEADFVVDGERSQAAWLLGTDVPDIFSQRMHEAADRTVSARIAQGFKELVMPTEMGERFRVLRLRTPS
jgi:SAM-dependent MidA family methyltransferase